MAESIYCAFLCMESVVRKHDLACGVIDTDHSVEKEALAQLDETFPSKYFRRTETIDTYVCSFKGELPASTLLELRKQFYDVYDVVFDYYETEREKEIAKELKGSDVKQLAAYCQGYNQTVFEPYRRFLWYTFEQRLPCGHHHSLPIHSAGIVIYCSQEEYEVELIKTLPILEEPLYRLMGDNPLKELISLRVIDLDGEY